MSNKSLDFEIDEELVGGCSYDEAWNSNYR